jgi:4-hydroxy-tetrahydrodipicolinate reductase
MGQAVIRLAHDDPEVTIGAALEAPMHELQGQDIGEVLGVGKFNVPVSACLPLEQRLDVLIDFSSPLGTMVVLPLCVQRKIPLVVATTGHTAEQKKEIAEAAHDTAILMAPNMSLAVNVLFQLVHRAAEVLRNRDFDVEILERHHRFKKDAPSGTALQFARVIQKAMGEQTVRHGRVGDVGERPRDEIGIHAIRVGDNVGEHTIVFSTLGETIELSHRAHSRECYARGALQSAKFLAGKPAGKYSMDDVLGL